jgi:HEAT repeats
LDDAIPDVKAANRHVDANDALVAVWADQGIVQDVLLPLLDDQSPAIRCAAAAYLLRHGATDHALTVLEALAEDDDAGLIASRAEALLIAWEAGQ